MNANAENTANTETITSEQWDEILSQLSGKLRRCVAGMPRSRAQWLIGNPNERIIAPVMAALMGSVAGENISTKERRAESVQRLFIEDPYLKYESGFEIVLPSGFTLGACSRDGVAFAVWDADITDGHFPYTGLERDKKYMAELYRLPHDMPLAYDVLMQIAKDNGRNTGGALGGALLGSKYRTYLPQGIRVICAADVADLYCAERENWGVLWPKVPILRRNGDRCHFTTFWRPKHIEGTGWSAVFFRELASSRNSPHFTRNDIVKAFLQF